MKEYVAQVTLQSGLRAGHALWNSANGLISNSQLSSAIAAPILPIEPQESR